MCGRGARARKILGCGGTITAFAPYMYDSLEVERSLLYATKRAEGKVASYMTTVDSTRQARLHGVQSFGIHSNSFRCFCMVKKRKRRVALAACWWELHLALSLPPPTRDGGTAVVGTSRASRGENSDWRAGGRRASSSEFHYSFAQHKLSHGGE